MKVLVVDDEVIIAKALSRAFASKGHTVFSAFTGEDGVDAWESEAPDVVLLDVVMPGLTGPQVVEEYRKRNGQSHSAALVVLMTAHSGITGRDSALKVGADDFIQKPFDNIFDLVGRIEKLLERKKSSKGSRKEKNS